MLRMLRMIFVYFITMVWHRSETPWLHCNVTEAEMEAPRPRGKNVARLKQWAAGEAGTAKLSSNQPAPQEIFQVNEAFWRGCSHALILFHWAPTHADSNTLTPPHKGSDMQQINL